MKAIAVGILAGIGMHIFGAVPMARASGGSILLWKMLLVDLIVGVLVYVVAA